MKPRVLAVIPGAEDAETMFPARRQLSILQGLRVEIKPFFLRSRTHPAILASELFRLRREISSFNPDLIHAHYGTVTALFCVLACRLPIVVTFRGSDLQRPTSSPWLRFAASRVFSDLACLRASAIICVSDGLLRSLRFGRSRAVVIPSGIDRNRFRPMPKEEARRRLGWAQESLTVVFEGRDPVHKRLDLAKSAIAQASRRLGRPVTLYRLDGTFSHDRMPECLNASDCLLVCSDSEGSPNIVKEALACGLPIVSVPVGDVALRTKDVAPGLIVARDAASLGDGLAAVLAQGMRSNGPDKVEELDEMILSARVLEVYCSVVDGPTLRSAQSVE